MKFFKSALLVICLLPFCAMNGNCGGIVIGPGGRVCTQIAVASVVLSVRNPSGQVVPTARATFRVGNSQEIISECNGNCGNFVIIYEVAGNFDIDVTSLGLIPENVKVAVSLDEAQCHPVTKSVTVFLDADPTTAALFGVWRATSGVFGDSILRFGTNGEIIGAILIDRTIAGDGNFYISYNNRAIRGVPNQQIFQGFVQEPTRVGNLFTFETTSLGSPVGFSNASMSADFQTLSGTLGGQPVSYRRLSETEIPNSIRSP